MDEKFSYMKFSLLSLAASSAMRLRSLHSWLIASMQADDWIPNNWNGVTAGVSVEGGLLGSDVNSFSDPALEPAGVSVEYAGFLKVQLVTGSFDVNVLSNLRFLCHTLPLVF